MERLCHLIDIEVARKNWKPIRLSQRGPAVSHIMFADDLILFAEASVAQVRVIRGTLEKFCVASGQKVNLAKSQIFLSKNVSRELGTRISQASGIRVTCDLGKYLGMPVLHKRINKETFNEVLTRAATRLAGWKGRMLSFAGRLTLTKSVLASLPVHMMSSIILPCSTLAKLDQLSRDFLWGSTGEKRKQHLLAWDKVCVPKREGGLGIRKARDMNMAVISKLGWRLLNDRDSLWARIIRAKYQVGENSDKSWLQQKRVCSPLWRGLKLGLSEVVFRGLTWIVGDGRTVKFWTDKWLMGEALIDSVLGGIPADYRTATVRDMWIMDGGWGNEQILQHIPSHHRLELSAVVVDSFTGARDRISWGMSNDGKFTVATAYLLVIRDETPRLNMERLYERIWKVIAPERIRTFLWLVCNKALMTNKERYRRHLSDTDICPVCRGGEEDILHILRDCPAMQGIWVKIVPRRKQRLFFSQYLYEWLYDNLNVPESTDGSKWPTMFAMAAWWGWKWRCGNVFGDTKLCRDRVKLIQSKAQEVLIAHDKLGSRNGRVERVEKLIGWVAPSSGWLKLNSDGASHGNPGLATAGGVLRNHFGDWVQGFALNIGYCSAPLAELWGVYYGLCIAWDARVERLELEVDSEIVAGFLTKGIGDSHPLFFLVRLCQGFLVRDWIVRVSHVYREANHLADGLANYAFSLPLGLHTFASVPDVCADLLSDDVLGRSYPRLVRI